MIPTDFFHCVCIYCFYIHIADGKIGFDCASGGIACSVKTRIIEMIDPVKASAGDLRYCHAGISEAEVLVELQRQKRACNKKISGQPVTCKLLLDTFMYRMALRGAVYDARFVSIQIAELYSHPHFTSSLLYIIVIRTGFPLAESVAPVLRSLLLTLKNDGVFEALKRESKPISNCLNAKSRPKPLSAYTVIGIWIVTIAFAAIGIAVNIYERREAIGKTTLHFLQHEPADDIASTRNPFDQTRYTRGWTMSVRESMGMSTRSKRATDSPRISTPTKKALQKSRLDETDQVHSLESFQGDESDGIVPVPC